MTRGLVRHRLLGDLLGNLLDGRGRGRTGPRYTRFGQGGKARVERRYAIKSKQDLKDGVAKQAVLQ